MNLAAVAATLFALAQRFPLLYKWFNVELSLSAARI
jgi:hypothetical protein